MKKILSGIVFALVLFTGMELQAQWVDKVTLYVPNRILDLLDEDDDVQAVYHNWDE